MTPKLFYVVYVGEPILQIALDVIRFIANSREKGLAHITVRGPYSQVPSIPALPTQIQGTTIRVTGVFDFFDANQNTVYLGCECDALRELWDKQDFGYHPHITLYDGESTKFARKLRELLSARPVSFKFRATRMSPLNSRAPRYPESLRQAMKTGVIPWLLGERLEIRDVELMPDDRRLELIERVWTDHVIARFAKHALRDGEHDMLFDVEQYRTKMPSRSVRGLHSVAVEAYLSVNGRRSIDRVLADPELNLDFVRECWKLGARATQYQLNKALLTARKNGEIGIVPNVRPYSLPRRELDHYVFASEVALRLVQDEEMFSRQRYASLDRILCEPALSFRFDHLARSIAPGFDASSYRWAAIAIRKGLTRKAKVSVLKELRFKRFGDITSLRLDLLSEGPGMYWLRHGDIDVYVGHAVNLRDEIKRIKSMNWKDIPISYESEVPLSDDLSIRAASLSNSSSSARDLLKATLLRQVDPTMNVLPSRRAS